MARVRSAESLDARTAASASIFSAASMACSSDGDIFGMWDEPCGQVSSAGALRAKQKARRGFSSAIRASNRLQQTGNKKPTSRHSRDRLTLLKFQFRE